MAIAHNGRVQYWHISILELQMSQRCQLLTAELSKYELLRRIIEEPNLRSRPNLNWRIVANALTEILQNSAFWTYLPATPELLEEASSWATIRPQRFNKC